MTALAVLLATVAVGFVTLLGFVLMRLVERGDDSMIDRLNRTEGDG